MRKFFNIETAYRFEMGDLFAILQIISVALIIKFGLVASWFGLGLVIFNLVLCVRDKDRHINGFVLQGALAVLNVYFLMLYYGI